MENVRSKNWLFYSHLTRPWISALFTLRLLLIGYCVVGVIHPFLISLCYCRKLWDLVNRLPMFVTSFVSIYLASFSSSESLFHLVFCSYRVYQTRVVTKDSVNGTPSVLVINFFLTSNTTLESLFLATVVALPLWPKTVRLTILASVG